MACLDRITQAPLLTGGALGATDSIHRALDEGHWVAAALATGPYFHAYLAPHAIVQALRQCADCAGTA